MLNDDDDDDGGGDIKMKSQHFQSDNKIKSTFTCPCLLTCCQYVKDKQLNKNNLLVLSNLLYADTNYWQENKISNILK